MFSLSAKNVFLEWREVENLYLNYIRCVFVNGYKICSVNNNQIIT